MTALFIAHGSKNIGMGHVMRTLSLASELRDRGVRVIYGSKYDRGLAVVQSQGFETFRMPAEELDSWEFQYGRPEDLQADLTFIKGEIRKETPDVIVVDSYNISEEYLRGLKQLTKCLVYIDDLNRFPYPVDLLVNGTVTADGMHYTAENPSEQLLLGTRYNLVRKEFLNPDYKVKTTVQKILITTGSADPYDMTGKFLRCLAKDPFFEALCFHVVVGNGFKEENKKGWESKTPAKVVFHENLVNLSAVIRECDLALSSGGSTLYELAAGGVPSIAFSYADNQAAQVRILGDAGVVKSLGSYEEIEENELTDTMKNVIGRYELRNEMGEKARRLVDGMGSGRIVDEIMKKLNGCGEDK